MLLALRCCKFLVICLVLRIPSEEGMHSARLGPHLMAHPMAWFFAFPKDVHTKSLRVVWVDATQFYAGILRGFCIINGSEVSVNGKLVFAECSHYGLVKAASWSLVRRVLYRAAARMRSLRDDRPLPVSSVPRKIDEQAGTKAVVSVPICTPLTYKT